MTTTTHPDVRTNRVRFCDGSRGEQTEYRDDRGNWSLAEIVIDRNPDGSYCRRVYGPRRFLADGVYGFQDLAGLTWEIDPSA